MQLALPPNQKGYWMFWLPLLLFFFFFISTTLVGEGSTTSADVSGKLLILMMFDTVVVGKGVQSARDSMLDQNRAHRGSLRRTMRSEGLLFGHIILPVALPGTAGRYMYHDASSSPRSRLAIRDVFERG
jgi:hypothetical protein